MDNVYAIIPIRSGSKRVKDKNIRDYKGKPLFMHSVDKAKKSNIFKEIIVASDSDQYLDMCPDHVVKYKRSSKLSMDKTSTEESLLEVILDLDLNGKFILLQATQPNRDVEDIMEFYKKMKTNSNLISISEGMNDKNNLVYKDKVFFVNGVLYGFDKKYIQSGKKLNHIKEYFITKKGTDLDIDYEDDFKK